MENALGWQCRDLCLSATPPKRQTFVSVADMSRHVGQQVGDILLSRPIFLPTKFCRGIAGGESEPKVSLGYN